MNAHNELLRVTFPQFTYYRHSQKKKKKKSPQFTYYRLQLSNEQTTGPSAFEVFSRPLTHRGFFLGLIRNPSKGQ